MDDFLVRRLDIDIRILSNGINKHLRVTQFHHDLGELEMQVRHFLKLLESEIIEEIQKARYEDSNE